MNGHQPSKKRKQAELASSSTDDSSLDSVEPRSKKLCMSGQSSAMEVEVEETKLLSEQRDYQDQQQQQNQGQATHRTPFKASLKKKTRKDFESSENITSGVDTEQVGGVEGMIEGASWTNAQSLASNLSSFASSRSFTPEATTSRTNRVPTMATNLRGSVRSSHGQFGQKQVKKLVVKSALGTPKLPENFEEITWIKLQEAVNSIHQRKPVSYSLEELYAGVEGLCTYNYSSKVYEKLELNINNHLDNELSRLEEVTTSKDSLSFLVELNKVWQDHCDHTLLIRSIFLTLDRQIAAEASSVRPIWEMGLNLFRKVIETTTIEHRSKIGLLEAIEADRNSQAIDRSLIKNICRMYISLGIYYEKFESLFLEETEKYYNIESERLVQEISLPAYLIHVEKRLEFESDTIGLYLAKSTIPTLMSTLHKTLIANHSNFIISKGFEELLDGDKIDDLKRIFSLLSYVDAHKPLRQAWNQYIKKRGSELVNDRSKDKTMIQELLNFRSRLDKILGECFAKDSEFAYSLKEGFEIAVNSRMNAPSEMLAKFLDKHLQVGNRESSSDVEFEALFERVMSIFRSLNSKDVFEAFYRKDLAKRLLLQKSSSIDAEKVVLGHLKDECGAQYTSKMEGMFKDIDLSKDLTTRYSEYLTETPDPLINPKTDIGIHVLTTGYWPSFTPIEIKLPSELAAIHQSFSKFYLKQFHARNLVWLNSHGHVTLRAAFPKGRRELSVSTFQATILLLFNDAETMTYADLKQASGIVDDDELKRTVLSLFAGKFKVLSRQGKNEDQKKQISEQKQNDSMEIDAPSSPQQEQDHETPSKEIHPDDIFMFNSQFTSKKVRIKINQIQLKETKVEHQKTQEAVFQDRQGQVDAAIVRIMKTRKTLSHNDLISEVIHILKFPFQASDLKKRIESLIEREFIARDKADSALYHYLA